MNPATDWIDQARGLLEMLKDGIATPPQTGDGGEHGSDCRWCPHCQAGAVLRGERPEVAEAIADVLTATATALRSFAETGRPAEDAAPPPSRERAPAGPGDPPRVMQRIDIA